MQLLIGLPRGQEGEEEGEDSRNKVCNDPPSPRNNKQREGRVWRAGQGERGWGEARICNSAIITSYSRSSPSLGKAAEHAAAHRAHNRSNKSDIENIDGTEKEDYASSAFVRGAREEHD